jgi:chromosome segregation ATPase
MFAAVAFAAQAAKVTPLEKVITLLKDLSAKVAAEGAKEATAYDKYACWCKEQADEKAYAIEKNEAIVADLDAEIKSLDTSIAELNSDITELNKDIAKLDGKMAGDKRLRARQHDKYLAAAKDMNEAIASCEAAIEALKDHKGSLEDAKVNLLDLTHGLVNAVQKQPMLQKASSQVSLLVQLQSKQAPKFQYQSNDIIATLEDLLATFKSMKKDLDFAEFKEKSTHEKKILYDQTDRDLAQKEKIQKQTIVEEKTETSEAAKNERDAANYDAKDDTAFRLDLFNKCRQAALTFDARSQVRSNELSTLSKATTVLMEGAVPNYSANKKLVELQKPMQVAKASSSKGKPLTFMQIRNVQNQESKKQDALHHVRKFLDDAAGRTGSRMLSTLAVRINLAEDHFAKVRELIQNLIKKLKEDAAAEADQKGTCDTGMKNAIADRDSANAKIETAKAKLTTLNANKNSLEDEIDTLTGQIAELKKGILEATELRGEGEADNTENLRMADEGAAAVRLAISILQKFYGQFIQTEGKEARALDEPRFVKDMMGGPEYEGAQSESKGIVGILEVILADFERQISATQSSDDQGSSAFHDLESETNNAISVKKKRISVAESEVDEATASILEQEQALSDGQDLLDSALETLDNLESMCVKGEETFAERKQKREEEIEALKDALAILEDWKR